MAMGYRLLGAALVFCFGASAQTISVDQLIAFVQSSAKMIQAKTMTDAELAKGLATEIHLRTSSCRKTYCKMPPFL